MKDITNINFIFSGKNELEEEKSERRAGKRKGRRNKKQDRYEHVTTESACKPG